MVAGQFENSSSESGNTENFDGTTLGAWPQGHMQGFKGGTTLYDGELQHDLPRTPRTLVFAKM